MTGALFEHLYKNGVPTWVSIICLLITIAFVGYCIRDFIRNRKSDKKVG